MILLNTFKKRIDELGRIVIPKEIRKYYKINNFDELELSMEEDSIVIKKTIGIELYKEKLDKFLVLLSNQLDFKIFIFNSNKLVSCNYKNINNVTSIELDFNSLLSSNNCINLINIGVNKIDGYIYTDSLINDSNLLGYIMFVSKEKFDNIDILKQIKNIVIDLIN